MPFDSYSALLEGIDEIVAAKKDLGTQARGRRLARRYWEIGDAIHAHLEANQGRTTYGEGLFNRLADDLNLDTTLVYTILRFRRGLLRISEQSGRLFRSESGRFLTAAETGGRHVPK